MELSKYKPICKVSSLYKVISKILLKRLGKVMSYLVGESKPAFVKGMNITWGVDCEWSGFKGVKEETKCCINEACFLKSLYNL